KDGVLGALLVIGPPHNLIFVRRANSSERNSAACIDGRGEFLRDVQRHLIQVRRRDLIVDELNGPPGLRHLVRQIDLLAVVTGGRGEGGKVTLEHVAGGNKRELSGGIGARSRPLVSAEEEQLDLQDRPAHGSTVLVALQRVTPRRKEVSGVEI